MLPRPLGRGLFAYVVWALAQLVIGLKPILLCIAIPTF